MLIKVKGSLHKEPPQDWQRRKDFLHKRRLELSERIKDGIMSKSEMNRGEEGEPEFDERVAKYSTWKTAKEKDMEEWSAINREFKKHREEGTPHSIDQLRPDGGKLKFD